VSFDRALGFVPARFLANPVGDFLFSLHVHACRVVHLLGNMLYLDLLAIMEDRLGHGLFLAFYPDLWSDRHVRTNGSKHELSVPNLGASGAIAGVLGGYIVMFPASASGVDGRYITAVPALVAIGLWIILQIFSGVSAFTASSQTEGGGIAYMAHIGGFFAGLVLAFVLGGGRRALPYNRY
jgi:membrane associated rhomboid family serine protease